MDKNMLYSECLENGVALQFKDVSLCDLKHEKKISDVIERRYQVWSPKFTHIYSNRELAVEKFIELCGK